MSCQYQACAPCLSLLLLLAPLTSQAATSLCVEVQADPAQQAGLAKLVLAELAQQPSHRVVQEGCASSLRVELFAVRGTEYLTARINQEVPVRYELARHEQLAPRLSEAIAQVLQHDPVYLSEDIVQYSRMERMAHRILKRGNTTVRVELFEVLARTGQNAATATGAAVALHRGADHWQVLARIYLAGSPQTVQGDDRVLQLAGGADIGAAYELFRLTSASPYLQAGLGAQLLRFEGYPAGQPGEPDHVTKLGATLHLRLGVRLFRWHDFDLDVFAQTHAPLFKTRHVDSLLFGEDGSYTPSLQLGMGVGF